MKNIKKNTKYKIIDYLIENYYLNLFIMLGLLLLYFLYLKCKIFIIRDYYGNQLINLYRNEIAFDLYQTTNYLLYQTKEYPLYQQKGDTDELTSKEAESKINDIKFRYKHNIESELYNILTELNISHEEKLLVLEKIEDEIIFVKYIFSEFDFGNSFEEKVKHERDPQRFVSDKIGVIHFDRLKQINLLNKSYYSQKTYFDITTIIRFIRDITTDSSNFI